MTCSDGLPLAGLRVLECVDGPMRMTGRLLADLGAHVVHWPQGPRAARGWRTTMAAGVDCDALALNRGKHAPEADFATGLARAHVLLEDSLDGLGADGSPAAIAARHPGLIHVSISDFGRDGPCAGWIASDPVLHALSGSLARSGIPGRPPVVPPGSIASACAATQAAFAVLLSLTNRLDRGQGDWIDFAVLDGVTLALDPGFGVMGSAAGGARGADMPRGRPEVRFRYPILPCADGHVRLCVLAPRQWQGMFRWMGSPPEFADPAFNQLGVRYASPTLLPAIAAFLAGQTKAQIERDGQTFGVPVAMVRSLDEAIATAQNEARGLFVAEPSACPVPIRLPQAPFEIDGQRPRAVAPQPDAVLPLPPAASDPARHLPLAGLRVLDLGVIVVGAETGRLLGDAGADVVKLENAAFPDGLRQTIDGAPISASFAVGNRNKRSLSLDLRDEAGRATFRDLVAKADVLLSNFKPGTLEALGFDHATLAALNPGLVAIDNSAFGPTGPGAAHLGYGPLVRAATGVTAAWSDTGVDDGFSDAMTVYPDHVAGRLGALLVLSLLIRRRRTGRGGFASVAQAEVILDHLAVDVARAELIAAGVPVRHDDGEGPWGVYPCAGEDEWCAVTIATPAQRAALRALLDAPTTLEPALEPALRTWLAARPPLDAARTLQAAGIPAGAMLRVAELPDFPHFAARGLFVEAQHPHLATPYLQEARPFLSRSLSDPPGGPGPLPGEQSAAVLHDWLVMRGRKL